MIAEQEIHSITPEQARSEIEAMRVPGGRYDAARAEVLYRTLYPGDGTGAPGAVSPSASALGRERARAMVAEQRCDDESAALRRMSTDERLAVHKLAYQTDDEAAAEALASIEALPALAHGATWDQMLNPALDRVATEHGVGDFLRPGRALLARIVEHHGPPTGDREYGQPQQAVEAELRAHWGSEYAGRIAFARRLVRAIDTMAPGAGATLESFGGHVDVVKWLGDLRDDLRISGNENLLRLLYDKGETA